jgi:tyrosyl-tRNA synthetase
MLVATLCHINWVEGAGAMTENELARLANNSVAIYSEQDWQQLKQSKKKLRIKLGCDPTRPDLHLGHVVVLDKLRQFQDLGHQIVFIIGDFTSLIGDPTDKSATRPLLTEEEIKANAATYKTQVGQILDLDRLEIRFNNEWLSQLSSKELILLAAKKTVARMLERDDFSKRFKQNQAISIHEFIYPLLQGYDSVALNVDLELGGTDQTFNMLMGRELQKEYGQKPQIVMTMPLIEGLDGVKKMSKSSGNTINLFDSAEQMFGKVMSLGDDLMWRYFTLLLAKDEAWVIKSQQEISLGKNPRDLKFDLALGLVARFHSDSAAKHAKEDFINRFQKGGLPDKIEEKQLIGSMLLSQLLKESGLVQSTSEALRMLKQKAVRIDSQVVEVNRTIEPGSNHIYQVGKRRILKVGVN